MLKKLKKTLLWQKSISPFLFFVRKKRCEIKKRKILKQISEDNFFNIPTNDKSEFIVSLTSHGERLENTVPYALYSLFTQNEMPDKIILYLNKEKWNMENLPSSILKFTAKGLEIRFVQDVGPHTKLIPALMEYPNSTIITSDDDIYYPPHWFEKLKSAHHKNPGKICCYIAHKVNLSIPYDDWEFASGTGKPAEFFCLGVHGILYPKNSLLPLVTDFAEFSKLAPKADDIWFWAMGALQKTSVFVIQDEFSEMSKKYIVDIVAERAGLNSQNVWGNQNEIQIKAVLERFSEIREMLCSK